jgi:hypothetical protein
MGETTIGASSLTVPIAGGNENEPGGFIEVQ